MAGNEIDHNLEIGFSGGLGSSPGGPMNKPAKDTIYQENKIGGKVRFELETGTKTSGFEGSIPEAVEVTQKQVGVDAPDPREETG